MPGFPGTSPAEGRRVLLGAQAAFGRGALAVSGFCIYVSLALGLLGSALAFPFGIYVVICQRNPEKYIQARCAAAAARASPVGVTGSKSHPCKAHGGTAPCLEKKNSWVRACKTSCSQGV